MPVQDTWSPILQAFALGARQKQEQEDRLLARQKMLQDYDLAVKKFQQEKTDEERRAAMMEKHYDALQKAQEAASKLAQEHAKLVQQKQDFDVMMSTRQGIAEGTIPYESLGSINAPVELPNGDILGTYTTPEERLQMLSKESVAKSAGPLQLAQQQATLRWVQAALQQAAADARNRASIESREKIAGEQIQARRDIAAAETQVNKNAAKKTLAAQGLTPEAGEKMLRELETFQKRLEDIKSPDLREALEIEHANQQRPSILPTDFHFKLVDGLTLLKSFADQVTAYNIIAKDPKLDVRDKAQKLSTLHGQMNSDLTKLRSIVKETGNLSNQDVSRLQEKIPAHPLLMAASSGNLPWYGDKNRELDIITRGTLYKAMENARAHMHPQQATKLFQDRGIYTRFSKNDDLTILRAMMPDIADKIKARLDEATKGGK